MDHGDLVESSFVRFRVGQDPFVLVDRVQVLIPFERDRRRVNVMPSSPPFRMATHQAIGTLSTRRLGLVRTCTILPRQRGIKKVAACGSRLVAEPPKKLLQGGDVQSSPYLHASTTDRLNDC